MRKHGFWQLSIIAMIMLVVPFAVAAEPTVVKMAHMWPEQSWPGRSIKIFGEGVEKATDGRIKFKYYLGGGVYSDYDSVTKSVIHGVQPFCFMYPPMLAVYDQRWNALGLPGAIMSVDQMHRVHYQSEEYQKLNGELAHKAGIKVLFWELLIPYGDVPFNTKRPLITIEDWKGLKMRVAPMDLQRLAMKEFGANPIVLQTTETLSALSLGAVDGGIITPGTAMTTWKADETLPYLTVPHGGWAFNNSMCGFIVNVKWWNKQSKDIQGAITKALPGIAKASQADVDKMNAKAFNKYESTSGNTVTYLTKEQTDVWNDLIQSKVMPQIFAKTPGIKALYEDFKKYR